MLRSGHKSHRMGPDLGHASMSRTGHKSLQNITPITRLEAGLASSLAALTPRQRAFYEHWWAEASKVWPRAYRSAQAAGYACPRSQGPRLLTMPNFRAAMDARIALERGLAQRERRVDRGSIRAIGREYLADVLAARLHR